MTGPPRSQRLLAHNFTASGISAVWTSPDGYVTLVKTAIAYNSSANTATVQMQFYPKGQAWAAVTPLMTLTTGASSAWDGWVVLNPGDAFLVQASAAGVIVWVSGAVLAGPNQFEPATRELPTRLPGNAGPEPRSGGQSDRQ